MWSTCEDHLSKTWLKALIQWSWHCNRLRKLQNLPSFLCVLTNGWNCLTRKEKDLLWSHATVWYLVRSSHWDINLWVFLSKQQQQQTNKKEKTQQTNKNQKTNNKSPPQTKKKEVFSLKIHFSRSKQDCIGIQATYLCKQDNRFPGQARSFKEFLD